MVAAAKKWRRRKSEFRCLPRRRRRQGVVSFGSRRRQLPRRLPERVPVGCQAESGSRLDGIIYQGVAPPNAPADYSSASRLIKE